jgi:chromosome segregation ATPase
MPLTQPREGQDDAERWKGCTRCPGSEALAAEIKRLRHKSERYSRENRHIATENTRLSERSQAQQQELTGLKERLAWLQRQKVIFSKTILRSSMEKKEAQDRIRDLEARVAHLQYHAERGHHARRANHHIPGLRHQDNQTKENGHTARSLQEHGIGECGFNPLKIIQRRFKRIFNSFKRVEGPKWNGPR